MTTPCVEETRVNEQTVTDERHHRKMKKKKNSSTEKIGYGMEKGKGLQKP